MSTAHFSVSTAATFVVGGIAAVLLATFLALGGYGRKGGASSGGAATTVAGPHTAGGAPTDAEIEYLLDSSEPPSPAAPHPP